MKYVALDFETANSSPTSACSVGMALVEDGIIIDTYYSLIRPTSLYFSPYNISIHGITPEDVKDAPTFETIWPEMLLFIDRYLLIAHNASFDVGILRALLQYYNLPLPHVPYTCTVRISRKVWPYLPSHKLTELSHYFGFSYRAHHALDDAINCALVFHKACPFTSEREVLDFFIDQNISVQKISGGNFSRKHTFTEGIEYSLI